MNRIVVGKENSTDIGLYYEDLGSGQPVVMIHGYPLSGRSFEYQVQAFLRRGYRVITYDRRGFGRSTQPSFGYNYDTFASDLNEVLNHLDLREVILLGFSMGGGEIARYVGRYGTQRLSKAIFISAITPHLSEGVDPQVFADLQASIEKDRLAFLTTFFTQFYGQGNVSAEVVRDSWNVASLASPIATLKSVPSWGEDFRSDLAKLDIPALVLHGDADQTVPIDASARRMKQFVPHALTVEIPGAPHGMLASHREAIETAVFDFLQADWTLNVDGRPIMASRPG